MQLRVNGEEKEFDAIQTVADLVAQYDLVPQRVAVEVNEQLVRRADYAATPLTDGDHVEIVTLVGGG